MEQQTVSIELDQEGAPFEVATQRNPVTREQIVSAIQRTQDGIASSQKSLQEMEKALRLIERELAQYDELIPPAPVKKKRKLLG